ncbi:hypothetical protein [Chromobacterium violaceum]|uniref:Uncharacterized protein n=2 Tax=Chromobacterium violaceum TaxID=536 RepID=Q7NWN8_CHRVO|nr:hypothetical protein [Chromobacterium violaceum]AAQ59617.1 hypothetical protein CV_1943 [Chromobacterium violaceum ATCC 12472]MBA8734936.1 hypothetical protein [Chromobacterium violaceum]OVE46991.1 hypothetical protein CBW21_16455 [Chromobacterium violaceum]SUX83950.1 Uncharacterised protein [Chromobacterium violaceum]
MTRLALIAAALLMSAQASQARDFSLLLFGASLHHGCSTCNLNQDNPGAGLEWAFAGDQDNGRWFSRAGVYRDSFRKDANFVTLGWRREWEIFGPVFAGIGLQAGYLHGSGHNGPAALPTISLGTQSLALAVGYLPRVNVGSHHPKTSVTTFNLRWTG